MLSKLLLYLNKSSILAFLSTYVFSMGKAGGVVGGLGKRLHTLDYS